MSISNKVMSNSVQVDKEPILQDEEAKSFDLDAFWKKILSIGLEKVLMDKDKTFRNVLLEDCIDLIKSNIESLNVIYQSDIIMYLFEKDATVLQDEFWKKYVENSLNYISSLSLVEFYKHSAWFVILNRIKDYETSVDWFSILEKLGKASSEVGSQASGFGLVLGWLIDADKNNLLKLLYKTESKSYPREMKLDLYQKLIKFGLLDEKLARRLRSDSSGNLSLKILEFLFSNRFMYSEEKFKSLITQFTDSKYKLVSRFIALNLPVELMPFLMGSQDKPTIRILSNRMQQMED